MTDSQDLLITPLQLKERLADPALCLIDTRPAEEFAQGRIPHAVHFDLFGLSLTDTRPAPLKAFLWMILHLLEMRGAGREKDVVFYEEISGMRAARGLWFLELFGHKEVHVLDGGIRRWIDSGYPITSEVTRPTASRLVPDEKVDVLATVEDVLRLVKGRTGCIVDTRSEDEYRGRTIRAARGGAIPGAVHLEWTQSLDSSGRFKSPSELREMYRNLGVTPDKEIITYCQGGYRAAHTYLALRLIGYPRVRNYLGSWKEWGDRPDLPIENP
jgi:thiosulfate/3-mercaptopyruvate sulfurtransferase